MRMEENLYSENCKSNSPTVADPHDIHCSWQNN